MTTRFFVVSAFSPCWAVEADPVPKYAILSLTKERIDKYLTLSFHAANYKLSDVRKLVTLGSITLYEDLPLTPLELGVLEGEDILEVPASFFLGAKSLPYESAEVCADRSRIWHEFMLEGDYAVVADAVAASCFEHAWHFPRKYGNAAVLDYSVDIPEELVEWTVEKSGLPRAQVMDKLRTEMGERANHGFSALRLYAFPDGEIATGTGQHVPDHPTGEALEAEIFAGYSLAGAV